MVGLLGVRWMLCWLRRTVRDESVLDRSRNDEWSVLEE